MTGNLANGGITVTTKAGKNLKPKRVRFTATAIVFEGTAISVPRQEVKEVVIRRHRSTCCEPLYAGLVPLALLVDGLRNDDIDPAALPFAIILSPIAVGIAAVTGPPLLAIEGIRHLVPARIACRVIP